MIIRHLADVLLLNTRKTRSQPGKSLAVKVTYKADHPEHFNKTIILYCNASASPLELKITGDAK